jgi:hypothetical protein
VLHHVESALLQAGMWLEQKLSAVRGADGFPLLVPSPSRTPDADGAISQPGSTAPRDAEVAPLGGDIRGDTSELKS